MRHALITAALLAGFAVPVTAQLSIGVSVPGISIGINVPVYPEFVRVPGYPVYYAPSVASNFFFYDGFYWVYQRDDWYASEWYDGPWSPVAPDAVPLFVLRVPVRYYRSPPVYFRHWQDDAPPRWGDHWGPGWRSQHEGWDRWNRNAVPAPAPLPAYQRRYGGDRYPTPDRQPALRAENYRHQPQDAVVRQHQRDPAPAAPPPRAERPARSDPIAPPPRLENPRSVAPRPDAEPRPRPALRERPNPKDGDRSDRGDKGDRGDNGDDRGAERKQR